MADAPVGVPVLREIPGQEAAIRFLVQALHRPHHAYLLAGPEGGGKQQVARAFAAALLCDRGGCGECRACALALADKHPNEFVVEPEGRDIHVETVREEIWHPAYRTAPEPGRKVFVVREADRLNPAAADVLLKVLEEPPADAVLLLLSARPDELPETVVSRCHVVSFLPLAEGFVARALQDEGVDRSVALLAARLAGGNLGRARRIATGRDGLSFRDAAREALGLVAGEGQPGALAAAEVVLGAADRYRDGMKEDLAEELAPFRDARGRTEDAFRGVVRRLEERHKRRLRRAERDYVDWVLLSASTLLRDRVVQSIGADDGLKVNADLDPGAEPGLLGLSPEAAGRAMGTIESTRAAVADETNLNLRLVLEEAFLSLAA
ncbi:MAG TPA: DNA polymerase III subunit [Actinomycetota bacterium]|jgi:DNA polymerase-3 subunit delta'